MPEPLEKAIRWYLASAEELAERVVSDAHADGVLGEVDDQRLDDWRRSLQSNLERMATLWLRGESPEEVVLPPQSVDYATRLVHRGVPVEEALRASRFALMYLWDWFAGVLIESKEPDVDKMLRVWTREYLLYVNRWTESYLTYYSQEFSRWNRSAATLRRATVDALLGERRIALDLASHRLGYELQRRHLAVVAWTDASIQSSHALRDLETSVAKATEALGCARPLVVSEGTNELWAWASVRGDVDELAVTADCVASGVFLSLGRPRAGLEGFRTSHVQASEAARLARMAGRTDPVTRYRDVEAISLLSSDIDRLRAFVTGSLGALAQADEGTEPLRATLLIYLDSGRSRTHTAGRLGVHQNTVTYRLNRIQDLLAQSLDDIAAFEVHTALTILRYFGPQLLQPRAARSEGRPT
jgi:hypothetical protein